MFSVRRVSPRIVSILAAAGLGLAALVALAAPASAHTAAFTRTCGSVTVNMTNFARSPENDPNVVDVFRDGTKIDTVQFTSTSLSKTYDQANTGTVVFETRWTRTGADNQSGSKHASLAAPTGCTPPCQEAGAFSYTFDGAAGKATVTLSGETPLCAPVTVLLASYSTEGATWETSGHQTVFDQVSQQISKPGTYPLQVKVPNCFAQVDLYVTDKMAVDFDFPNDTLGQFLASTVWPKAGGAAAFNGGTTACVTETTSPTPSVTPTTVSPTSAAPPAAAPPGDSLPNTGASPTPKILLALLLLSLGTALVFLGRRRRATAH
jgi:LPXTG-motif cell wall-anchored protein